MIQAYIVPISAPICTSTVSGARISTHSSYEDDPEISAVIDMSDIMNVPKCEPYITIRSEEIIDDKNDFNDIISCVNNDVVHSKDHDLVTLSMHIEPSLLIPDFGLLIGDILSHFSNPYFTLLVIDYSRVMIQKFILDNLFKYL